MSTLSSDSIRRAIELLTLWMDGQGDYNDGGEYVARALLNSDGAVAPTNVAEIVSGLLNLAKILAFQIVHDEEMSAEELSSRARGLLSEISLGLE